MANPTANDILELKKIVNDYLKGKSIRVIRIRLAELADELGCRCETLYEAIKIHPTVSDPLIDAMLAHLNINKSDEPITSPGRYEKLIAKSQTLHELLKHIAHDGELQVEDLLTLIEKTTPKYNWPFIFGTSTLISAFIGAFAYFENAAMQALGQWLAKTFPVVVDWLGKTFCILHNIPLLGIIYNALALSWYWYSAVTKGSTTNDGKLNALLFKSLSSSLTILAYTLAYFASGVMTGLPATLFVLSASVHVFRSIFIWYKSSETLATLKQPPYNATWQIQAEYLRVRNYNQRAQQSFWIELSGAILITAAVAIWDFFPPSLAVSAFCVIFITLTGLAEKSMLSHIAKLNANNLQRELDHLPNVQEPLLSLESTDNYAKIQQMREDVIKQKALFALEVAKIEAKLAARESDIARREQQLARKEHELDQLIQDVSQRLEHSAESIRNIRQDDPLLPAATSFVREESHSPTTTPIFSSIYTLFGQALEGRSPPVVASEAHAHPLETVVTDEDEPPAAVCLNAQ